MRVFFLYESFSILKTNIGWEYPMIKGLKEAGGNSALPK